MTVQYQQQAINESGNPALLERMSFDERQAPGLVPTGTTSTMQRLKVLGIAQRLSRISWSGVVPAGGGETITIRLIRIRPSSNPSGFGFINLITPFVIDTAALTDFGGNIDISDRIIPNQCVLPGEYLAPSWVQSGAQGMRPLNVNWNFTQVSTLDPEPSAFTTNPVVVFG